MSSANLQNYNHYRSNLNLALPVVLSQAGQIVVVFADNLMVGQLGATQLAAAAFANSIFLVGMVFGIGLAMGITPLVGTAFGSGDRIGAIRWLKKGFKIYPLLAVVQALIMACIALLIPYMGQSSSHEEFPAITLYYAAEALHSGQPTLPQN